MDALPPAVRTALIALLSVVATAATLAIAILIGREAPYLITQSHVPTWALVVVALVVVAGLVFVRQRGRRRWKKK